MSACFWQGLPGDTPASHHFVPSAASESLTYHILFLIEIESMCLLLENLKHLENTEFCLRLRGSREIGPRATGPLPSTGNTGKRRVLL